MEDRELRRHVEMADERLLKRQRFFTSRAALDVLETARKPGFGARPVRLCEQHVSQPLASTRGVLVIRLRFGESQTALERPRTLVEIAAGRLEPAEVTERFHLRLTVAELLGDAERLAVPGVRLRVADAALLVFARAHQRPHRLREVAALLRFERVHCGVVQRGHAARDAVEHLRHARPERGGIEGPFPDRTVRLGRRPRLRRAARGEGHNKATERREIFDVGQQSKRLFHTQRRALRSGREAHDPLAVVNGWHCRRMPGFARSAPRHKVFGHMPVQLVTALAP